MLETKRSTALADIKKYIQSRYKPIKVLMMVSGLCGSGKTHAMVEHIASLPKDRHDPHIITGPSIRLCEQTYQALRAKGVNAQLLHSEVTDNVSEAIREYLGDRSLPAKVLVCTQAGLEGMSYIPNQKNTVLFVDEAPLLDKFYRRALPYNPSHLIDRVA